MDCFVPPINQMVCRKKTSHADQSLPLLKCMISRHVNFGSSVLMCLYDLQKDYDSVEYPVLLERLYGVGINGKLWRLLKNW